MRGSIRIQGDAANDNGAYGIKLADARIFAGTKVCWAVKRTNCSGYYCAICKAV